MYVFYVCIVLAYINRRAEKKRQDLLQSTSTHLTLPFLSHLFFFPLSHSVPPLFHSVSLFSQQICASVSFDICTDALAERGFLKVASRQPKCAVQEKVLLAYCVLRRPIHIILKQLESRTSIPVRYCSVQENR